MDPAPAFVPPAPIRSGFVRLTLSLLAAIVGFTAVAGLVDSMPVAAIGAVAAAAADGLVEREARPPMSAGSHTAPSCARCRR
jgi:hypothetical protein